MGSRLSLSGFLSWLVNHTFLMGRHFRKPTLRQLLICLAAALLIGALLGLAFGSLALLISPGRFLPFSRSWLEVFARAVIQLEIFALAFFLFCGIPGVSIIPWTVRMPASIGRWVRGFIYFLGGSLAMGVGLWVLPEVTGVEFLSSGRMMTFIVAVDGLMTTILGAVVFSYQRMEVELDRRVNEISQREREAADLRRSVDASRLSALQAQINPHFFFNTLNSIAALIPRDSDRAVRTIEQLGGLFRYTMRSSEEVLVRFSEELNFVRDYLEIEKLRYGARLTVQERISSDTLAIEVPGLFLQPVVENAVKHGIAGKTQGGMIRIEAFLTDGSLNVTVADNGPGFGGKDPLRSQRSLHNVRRRLRLLFGDRATLTARRDIATGETTMSFTMPTGDKEAE